MQWVTGGIILCQVDQNINKDLPSYRFFLLVVGSQRKREAFENLKSALPLSYPDLPRSHARLVPIFLAPTH